MQQPTDAPPVPSMVQVPGGAVDLRDDRRGTRWRTEIAPFLLGRFPVTAELYRAVTGRDLDPAASGAAPAVNVSWLDAVDVCNQLSVRSGLTPTYRHDPRTGDAIDDLGFRLARSCL